MENLKIIDILKGESIPLITYKGRFSHAFSFKLSGQSMYHFGEKTMVIHPGEMMYIPKGSEYRAERMTDSSEYVLINFDADMGHVPPQIFSMDGCADMNYVREQLPRLWRFGDASDKCKCYAAFYSVLSFVLSGSEAKYAYTTKQERIAPAVEYLHSHIFDCDLRVETLSSICGISDTYFRKIFRAGFNVSPHEYIANKRLDQARSLIMNGAYNSIAEVALSVGYADPLYFSRVYSRHFGHCPYIDGIKKSLPAKDFSEKSR